MRRLLFVVAVVLGVVSTPALTAGAAQTTTYHGVFSGPVVYKGCTTTPHTTIASGTWGVALHGQTDATVNVNIFTDGAHHLSFGGTFAQIAPEKNQTFAVEIPTQAGDLVVSLKEQVFSYQIAPSPPSASRARASRTTGCCPARTAASTSLTARKG